MQRARESPGRAVYPRWRGEHVQNSIGALFGCGLSPLARGTRRMLDEMVRYGRFIPAGAGNTQQWHLSQCSLAVYPRWRGEHRCVRLIQCVSGGLSPLARGTHISLLSGQLLRRFIPAGAGNTARSTLTLSCSSVYPRWRGEHSVCSAVCIRLGGLSPLARGTPVGKKRHESRLRFIPAGAGNTLNGYNCL